MTDSVRFASLAIVVAAFLSLDEARAHGGADVPLFVAEDGSDSGGCLDEASPCRSLSYALSMAGKGAEIRIAEGSYPIENPEDLFHVLSGMVDVTGGFKQSGRRFVERTGVSTLTGVPPQFRALLKNRGFNVVSDRKAIEGPKAAEAEKLLALHQQLKAGLPASPCVGGMAGDLACNAVDLLAHFSFDDVSATPASATDVWGFVDLNTGREYAIIGYDIGTAVVDVSDPENPLEVGFIDGQPAFWRDIKVYQSFDADAGRWRAFAYVTTDGSTDGLFVIDMSGLPHAIRKVNYASDFNAAHNVYATNTDYSTGLALTAAAPTLAISGSSIGSGQYRAYSLADPAAPSFVAGANTPDYMHDASSIIITDTRKDSQCVNPGEWCEVLLDFNELTIDVWDVTDTANPARLSRTPYPNARYVHSGWWSEDRQFVFVHDELDEQQLGLNTTVRVFSIADLNTPVQVGEWTGPTRAIDHNGFVRGNRYYISNYARGLTVLDITDPTEPVDVGSLDTYPFSDNTAFVGAWGTYPFFFSGTVAISDIDTGLYLARDRSVEVAQGQLSFGSRSYAGDEGQSVALIVRRTGGSTGAVSVAFEVVHATADADDYQVSSGTLDWPGGDASDRAIDVALVNDASTEGLERLLVRLVDPRGGATLGPQNVASVYASDPGVAAEVGFFAESVEIAERGFATAVLVLQRSGSAVGPASVDFAMGVGDAVAGADFDGTTSGTLAWPAGDGEPKTLLFTITDDDLDEETEFAEVSLSNATGAAILGSPNATIAIANGRGSNLAPNAVAGGSQTVSGGATVTLDGGQSNDPDGDSLTFQWTQTSGPQVTLSGAATAVAQFTAPTASSDTMLRFTLTASDAAGLSDSATTVVTVMTSGGDGGGGGASVVLILLCLTALAGRAAAIRVNRMDVA
ncbi:MAG TPA: choice-of-anchor B family protein [Woeseiaceae bacterium]|nr:choice-of-anchor B family protein [Woeseiaceae bacterium]